MLLCMVVAEAVVGLVEVQVVMHLDHTVLVEQ